MSADTQMKLSYFKQKIKNKGEFKELAIYPYFSDEDKVHGKPVILSSEVDVLTYLVYRKKPLAMIIPYKDRMVDALMPYKDEITKFVGVAAPVFAIYNMEKQKIGQLQVS